MERHFDVVIVGGGTAGITVAAQLRKRRPGLTIAIVDAAETHYYQPLFTLIGGGLFKLKHAAKKMQSLLPKRVTWVKYFVRSVEAETHGLTLENGEQLSYDYLVLCPGLVMHWHKIEGLPGQVGKNGVCSNYDAATVEQTWATIKSFTGGTALFTFPSTPVKCGGAPQKIMYLAEDHFQRTGIRGKCDIKFMSAAATIFAVNKYATVLDAILRKRNLKAIFQHDLVRIDVGAKQAYFKDLTSGDIKPIPYDMIHVTPPMGAPAFIAESGLANAAGFIDVDALTLHHTKFRNIFGLGDASSLPTSKTGAAIRKQAPVVVTNLLAAIDKKIKVKTYDGYTSCPIVTRYGKLILAEFDYKMHPVESFPFNQAKERLSMYLLKKYLLPFMYWYAMLKGRV